MKKEMKKLGILTILLGFVLIINSSIITITGNAVNNIPSFGGSILGLVFIVAGLVIFASRKAGGLEGLTIKYSKRFEKDIKNVPKKIIERAISKIRSGLGKGEYLYRQKKWSVRTSKGGRILYELDKDSILLTNYNPPSKHKYST